MKREHIKRLTILKKYLRTIPEEFYTQRILARREHLCIYGTPNVAKILAEHKCGTAACALGWSPLIPEFAAAGLKYDECGRLSFEDKHGALEVAEMFFGLTTHQARYIFWAEHYPNYASGIKPADVIKNINYILARYS